METDTNTSLQIKITRPKITVDFPYGDYEIDSVDETFNLTLNSDGYVKAQIDFANINLYGNIFDDKELTLDLREKYIRGSLFEIRAGTQLSLPVCYNNEDTGEIVDTGKKYTLGVIEFDPNQIKEEWKINRDFKITYGITQGATPTSSTWLEKDNWPKIKCGNHQFNTTTIKYSGGSIPVWVNNLNKIVQYQYNLNENGIDYQLSFAYDNTGVGSENKLHLTRSTPDVYITLDGNGNITTGNQKFSLEEDCVAVSLGYGNYDAPFLSVDLNGGVNESAGTLAGYHVIAVDGIRNVTNGDYLFYNKAFYNDHIKFDGDENDVYFGSKLSNLKSGRYMFAYCEQLKYFPVDLSSLIDGSYMFSHCTLAGHYKDGYLCTDHQRPLLDNLEIGDGMFSSCYLLRYFESAVSTLISAKNMFANTALQKFTSSLENLVYGNRMFYSCNLTSFKSNLNSLEDGSGMFDYCDKLKSFSSDLSSLTNGSNMFYRCSALTTFSPELSSLTYGDSMFSGCYNLTAFSSDLSSLTSGSSMFYKCTALTTFTSDLSKLENFDKMFYGCTNLKYFDASLASISKGTDFTEIFDANIKQKLQTFISNLEKLQSGSELFRDFKNLTTFEANLSSLTNGEQMFSSCTSLNSFDNDLGSLTDAIGMFQVCTSLASFTSNLSSLKDGQVMFHWCNNLTNFDADLGSLIQGDWMFSNCKLNGTSVKKILTTIPTYDDGSQHILDMTMDESGCERVCEICNLFYFQHEDAKKIPQYTSNTTFQATYKGWTLRLSTNVTDGYVLPVRTETKFDVVEESDYIPNANSWNQHVNNETEETELRDKILQVTHVQGNMGKIKTL